MLPDVLTHYYECATGPFRSLSDLPPDEAERVQAALVQRGDVFASRRQPDYLSIRRELEARVRARFVAQGGQPTRAHPHSMLLGECAWLKSWYRTPCRLCVPLDQFERTQVSFTYGDLFPALRYTDGKPYRGQVFMLDELPALVERYGLPQDWNAHGAHGPDRYIEAQVWDDAPLRAWLTYPPAERSI